MSNYPFHIELEPVQKAIEAEMKPHQSKNFCHTCKIFFYVGTACHCPASLNPDQSSLTSVPSGRGLL